MSNQEEIIESNKILAEFEGYKYYPHPNKDAGWRKEGGHIKLGRKYYLARTHKDLRYHSDYNDLMRVWFKFKNLDLKLDNNRHQFLIQDHKGYIDLISHLITTTSINCVCGRLVEAIKWYNDNILNKYEN